MLSCRIVALGLGILMAMPGQTPVGKEKETVLPAWIAFGGQLRGRLESPSGVNYISGSQDTYFLTRARLNVSLKPTSWFRFFGEAQDTRAFGYDNAPPTAQDPLDFRQAYFEIRPGEGKGLSLRVGRVELNYGGGRLVAPVDWANVGRSFDGGVLSLARSGTSIDLFHASVVSLNPTEIDRHKAGEGFSGIYLSNSKWIPSIVLEPYLFRRTLRGVVGKDGMAGGMEQYSGGFRWTGKAPKGFDHSGLLAIQRGSYAHDRISALAANYMLGWTLRDSRWTPRFSAEYNHGSGDQGPGDRTRGTYDQLYGSFHYFLGTADRLGWRNSRQFRAGVEFSPAKRWKVFVDGRDLRLTTVKDALYNASGTRVVLNRNATSAHVGFEADSYFTWQATKSLTVGAGMGYLVAGQYVRQSTPGSNYLLPYVMIAQKF